MKNIISVLIILFLSWSSKGQIITTIAGTGVLGYGGNGSPATAAKVKNPVGIIFDNEGNLIIADGSNRIRKISVTGIITTIAGNGSPGYSGDGSPATDAMIETPQDVIVDTLGNIYYSDIVYNRIRVISTTGVINTFAGTGVAGYSADGSTATAAMITDPLGLACDKYNNLYFTDANNLVRKISPSGIISTVAGSSSFGFGGDGGAATNALLYNPHGIAIDDSGSIYITDLSNNRIRKVSSTGIISTIAGNGTYGYSGDGFPATDAELEQPWDIKVDDSGYVFFSEYGNSVIRRISPTGIISTVAGTGVSGYTTDDVPATSSELNNPYGICFDACGNLFVADGHNNRIREIAFNPTCTIPSLQVNTIENKTMNIYPNPTSNLLQIDNITASTCYHLLSVVGAAIQQGTLQEGSNSISLNALPTGMYLLQLTDVQGGRVIKKIIKE